jgi:hypothetical protein
MYIIDCELYSDNFGGTKLKRNYIWVYANKKSLTTTALLISGVKEFHLKDLVLASLLSAAE